MTLSIPNIDQLRKRWTAGEYLAELIIEVSDASIALDREIAFEYAAISPEYWLRPSGFRYTSIQTAAEDGQLNPLCRADVSAVLRDLFEE